MKRIFTLFVMLLAIGQMAIAQIHKCGQPTATQNLIANLPEYEAAIAKTFETARKNSYQKAGSRSRQVLTVPIVVHVVYNTDVQNISDELIHSQIDVLNKDFQRLNSDAGDARALFQGIGRNYAGDVRRSKSWINFTTINEYPFHRIR